MKWSLLCVILSIQICLSACGQNVAIPKQTAEPTAQPAEEITPSPSPPATPVPLYIPPEIDESPAEILINGVLLFSLIDFTPWDAEEAFGYPSDVLYTSREKGLDYGGFRIDFNWFELDRLDEDLSDWPDWVEPSDRPEWIKWYRYFYFFMNIIR